MPISLRFIADRSLSLRQALSSVKGILGCVKATMSSPAPIDLVLMTELRGGLFVCGEYTSVHTLCYSSHISVVFSGDVPPGGLQAILVAVPSFTARELRIIYLRT